MDDKQYIFGSIFLLANKLQAIGDSLGGELPIKQWYLLVMISIMEQELPTMTEVARFVGGTRQNTTRMLQALEKKGYVNLTMVPEDRTSMRVIISQSGKDYLEQTSPVGNAMLEKIFISIDAQSLSTVSDMFRKLFENIERWQTVDN